LEDAEKLLRFDGFHTMVLKKFIHSYLCKIETNLSFHD